MRAFSSFLNNNALIDLAFVDPVEESYHDVAGGPPVYDLPFSLLSSTPRIKKTGGIAIPTNTTGHHISSSTHSDTVRSYGHALVRRV